MRRTLAANLSSENTQEETMKSATLGAGVVLFMLAGTSWADEDITNKIQEMRKFGDEQQRVQEQQQYKQYLQNNDRATGISQHSGPTGSVTKGGGTVGYKWSTK
jgi:bifunctional ADP-heptose synthase (sugar kinase/adenylyltransferase)